MAIETINNGESGKVVRDKINGNFGQSLNLDPTDGLQIGGAAPNAQQRAAVRAGIGAAHQRGNGAIVVGDSIAHGAWPALFAMLSGGRLRILKNVAVGGSNSTATKGRLAADLLAHQPDYVILGAVTPNDPGQGISVATSIANAKEMVEMCISAGSVPLLCSDPPSDIAGNRSHMRQVSIALQLWANKQGIQIIDLYTPIVDPADGTYLSTMTGDGTHPSAAGHRAIADYNAARFTNDLDSFSLISSAVNDPLNLAANGLFLTDTNADGLADSFTKVSGTGATTLQPVTAGYGLGNWQVITPDGSNTQLQQNIATVVGRVYEYAVRVFITGAATIRVRTPAGDFPGDFAAFGSIDERQMAIASIRFTAVGTSSQFLLGVGGASGTAGFAQFTVRDITALEALTA